MISKLDWDSDFFGLRIGKVVISSPKELKELIVRRKSWASAYDLIYVFCSEELVSPPPGATLVDVKRIYSKQVTMSGDFGDQHVHLQQEMTSELYSLAFVSGHRSRFKIDKQFPHGSFEKLYSVWIEKSVSGEMAKGVLVYEQDNHILGMLTIDWNSEKATLGIGAVDKNAQSGGIGTIILKAAESFLRRSGGPTILEVATQRDNMQACRWYEKNDFVRRSETYIYHWWI